MNELPNLHTVRQIFPMTPRVLLEEQIGIEFQSSMAGFEPETPLP